MKGPGGVSSRHIHIGLRMNPGQVGLGSSRPESTRPGQLGRVKSALYIWYSCVLVDRERCSKREYEFVIHYFDFLKFYVSSLLLPVC